MTVSDNVWILSCPYIQRQIQIRTRATKCYNRVSLSFVMMIASKWCIIEAVDFKKSNQICFCYKFPWSWWSIVVPVHCCIVWLWESSTSGYFIFIGADDKKTAVYKLQTPLGLLGTLVCCFHIFNLQHLPTDRSKPCCVHYLRQPSWWLECA